MLIELSPELLTRLRIATGPRADSAIAILKEGEVVQTKSKAKKKEAPDAL